jgi:hypothetical protein
MIADYFDAERAESLLFIAVGLAALGLAAWCWLRRGTPAARGAAAALAVVAVIQLVVGTTVRQRSPHDMARVTQAVQADRPHIAQHEIPRMQAVMRNFELFRWTEIGLLALGLLLAVAARRGSIARGVGWGLAPQAALMLLLDFFAERRGAAYLAWLQAL